MIRFLGFVILIVVMTACFLTEHLEPDHEI
ncbi:hypothetical protein MMA231_00955 [Asticcacaulis sp. MM231]